MDGSRIALSAGLEIRLQSSQALDFAVRNLAYIFVLQYVSCLLVHNIAERNINFLPVKQYM